MSFKQHKPQNIEEKLHTISQEAIKNFDAAKAVFDEKAKPTLNLTKRWIKAQAKTVAESVKNLADDLKPVEQSTKTFKELITEIIGPRHVDISFLSVELKRILIALVAETVLITLSTGDTKIEESEHIIDLENKDAYKVMQAMRKLGYKMEYDLASDTNYIDWGHHEFFDANSVAAVLYELSKHKSNYFNSLFAVNKGFELEDEIFENEILAVAIAQILVVYATDARLAEHGALSITSLITDSDLMDISIFSVSYVQLHLLNEGFLSTIVPTSFDFLFENFDLYVDLEKETTRSSSNNNDDDDHYVDEQHCFYCGEYYDCDEIECPYCN